MANEKQNLVMVLLIIVIVVALVFVLRTTTSKKTSGLLADWACEQCDYQFMAPLKLSEMECPKCGGEAVRVIRFYCSVHDHTFEAYRTKIVNEGKVPIQLYKMPGIDKWVLLEPPLNIVCPQGNSNMQTLKKVDTKKK